MEQLSLSQLYRELYHTDYVCMELPGIMLKFLPGGILEVFGENPKMPIMHRYTLSHNGDSYYMETSPSLMNEPNKMKLMIMKNHLTLHSEAKDDQGTPLESLHFNKLRPKAYDSTK